MIRETAAIASPKMRVAPGAPLAKHPSGEMGQEMPAGGAGEEPIVALRALAEHAGAYVWDHADQGTLKRSEARGFGTVPTGET
jgi:hypothetical protein